MILFTMLNGRVQSPTRSIKVLMLQCLTITQLPFIYRFKCLTSFFIHSYSFCNKISFLKLCDFIYIRVKLKLYHKIFRTSTYFTTLSLIKNISIQMQSYINHLYSFHVFPDNVCVSLPHMQYEVFQNHFIQLLPNIIIITLMARHVIESSEI